MKFENESCPVCGELFTENDNIAVCPECGTPHHRACWKELGECKNAHRHAEGFVWKPSEKAAEMPELPKIPLIQNITCPECGCINEPSAKNCERCGHVFSGNLDEGEELRKVGPLMVRKVDIRSVKLDGDIPGPSVAAYLGNSGAVYLPRFCKMEQVGSKVTFSLVAALFGPLWCFFKGLYKLGLIITAISFIAGFLALTPPEIQYYDNIVNTVNEYAASGSADVSQLTEQLRAVEEEYYNTDYQFTKRDLVFNYLNTAVNIGSCLFLGLFGTYFYKKKACRDIRSVMQKEFENTNDLLLAIRKKGRAKILPCVLFVLFEIIQPVITYGLYKIIF